MKQTIKLKKESYRAWSTCGAPEASDSYRWAWQCMALAVTAAKTCKWEEFNEAMEQDFKSAPKKFWETDQKLRRGSELLTSAECVDWRSKEHFKNLLNSTDVNSLEEAELEVGFG